MAVLKAVHAHSLELGIEVLVTAAWWNTEAKRSLQPDFVLFCRLTEPLSKDVLRCPKDGTCFCRLCLLPTFSFGAGGRSRNLTAISHPPALV